MPPAATVDEGETFTPPASEPRSIAILTGADLRHRRFALLVQREFPKLAKAWFECPAFSLNPIRGLGRRDGGGFELLQRARKRLLAGRSSGTLPAGVAPLTDAPGSLRTLYYLRKRRAGQLASEKRLFSDEVAELMATRQLDPEPVSDPNGPEFLAQLKALNPYFLLVLGGPLLRSEVLACARGLALNQHAGWSPDYKGSHTIEWALYHRDLDAVGATVHLMSAGADAGPILRRARAALLPEDTLEDCFSRVVALGSDLMVEVLREVIAGHTLPVLKQDPAAGRTYRGHELDGKVLARLYRDFASGWLAEELVRRRRI